MSRQASRKRTAAVKKKVEKMSISEFEKFLNDIVRNARADTMEHFRLELAERYGFGKKRWTSTLIGVSHRITASDMEKGE